LDVPELELPEFPVLPEFVLLEFPVFPEFDEREELPLLERLVPLELELPVFELPDG